MTTVPIPAGPAHIAVLAALQAGCFAEDAWSEAAFARLLAMPGSFAFVVADPDPVGFVLGRVAADEAEIISLGVAHPARRGGLGALLLEAARLHARQAGARLLFLEVAEDNDAAIALYRAAGFSAVGRRSAYYDQGAGGKADALILSRAVIRACAD